MRRITGALWLLASLLLLLNAYLFWNYSTTNVEGRDQLSQIRAETDGELQKIAELRQALSGFDLREQNEEIRFLNRRIAERAFPWSELFEQLGEVLPRGVMVNSLAPTLPETSKRARGREVEMDDRVTLRINGTAENSEELLTFLDMLFAHPAFEEPLLERERQERGARLVSFDLETFYRPRFEREQGDGAVLASNDAGETSETSAGDQASGAAGSQEPLTSAAGSVPDSPPGNASGSAPGSTPARSSAASTTGNAATARDGAAAAPAGATPSAGANPVRPDRENRTRPQRSQPNASQAPGLSGSGGVR